MCLMSFVCVCYYVIIIFRNSNINGEDSCKELPWKIRRAPREGEFSFSDGCGDELILRAHNIHGTCKGM